MAFDFPSSPVVGQTFSPAPGTTYTYNGYGWSLSGSVPPSLNLIAIRTANNQAAVEFTSLLDASYDEYEIHFYEVVPVSNLNTLGVQIGQAGVYKTTGSYTYNGGWTSSAGSQNVFGASGIIFGAISLPSNLMNVAGASASGILRIPRPSSGSFYKYMGFETFQALTAPGGLTQFGGCGWMADTNPIDSVRFVLNAGNIASGTFKLFGVGTARQAVPPSGSRILLGSQTVSAAVANVDFLTGIDATYDEYELVFMGVKLAADGANFGLRISQDGGATFKAGATDYYWEGVYINTTVANSAFISNNTGSTFMRLTTSVLLNAAIPIHGKAKFFRPWASAERKYFIYESICAQQTQGNTVEYGGGQYGTDNNPFNAVRLVASAGNITAGTFNLYGTKK